MVTLPTLMPASCRARVALPRGCPVRLGMTKVSGSGPSLISRLIFGAATPVAFGGGF